MTRADLAALVVCVLLLAGTGLGLFVGVYDLHQ